MDYDEVSGVVRWCYFRKLVCDPSGGHTLVASYSPRPREGAQMEKFFSETQREVFRTLWPVALTAAAIIGVLIHFG